jgi:hypothetical protein
MERRILFFILFVSFTSQFFGQIPHDTLSARQKKNRQLGIGIGAAALATGSLTFLDESWYRNYKAARFHFFNDDYEWQQMDKAGHCFTTYTVGRLMMGTLKWAGFSRNQYIFIGGTTGLAYMTVIEVLDGFSSGWGFSWGDMGANVTGSALAISQEYFWNEQRITLKFSDHRTSYPPYRPSELGSNAYQEILKDYNGQSYWLSVNIASFLKKETHFPRWLNVAIGYGAEGMISGDPNYVIVESNGTIIGNDRYRKLLISLDVDFTKIKTRSPLLKGLFGVINCFKVPFPTYEISNHGGFHWLYF